MRMSFFFTEMDKGLRNPSPPRYVVIPKDDCKTLFLFPVPLFLKSFWFLVQV